MRAEKSRGSRMRSPSSRNELIETEIRQKARPRRAFSFCRQVASPITACDVFSGQYFYGRCSAVQQAGLMPRARHDDAAIDRAGLLDCNCDNAAALKERTGVTLFRRARKNAFA